MNNNNNPTACTTEVDCDSSNARISTLIFMDLETTGLPGEIGKKNVHITEISLIAIDRNDFETDNTLRVLNKLSLCIRPRASVSPTAMFITGLYNDVLENQEEFDDSVPKMLEFFFRRLRTPICLLAHNGKKFDFPVLQAELKRLNYTLDSNVHCADTLEAFRTICKASQNGKTTNVKLPVQHFIENKSNQANDKILNGHHQKENFESKDHCDISEISDRNRTAGNQNKTKQEDEIESLLLEDLECFQDIEEPSEFKESNLQVSEKSDTENPEKLNNCNNFVSIFDDEHTPQRAKINNFMGDGKQLKRRENDCKDETIIRTEQRKRNLSDNLPIAAKRKLFAETNGTKDENHTAPENRLNSITSFTLEKLYRHFFGEAPPQSHYAEADCIALSKVCQKIKDQFLNWIDNNSSEFSKIQPLW